MDQEQKDQIALFRFGVISELIGRRDLRRGERESLIRDLTDRQWEIPGSGRTRVSRSTIREWLRRYEESGRKLESLVPKDRGDMGISRSIDAETEMALVNLKREYPKASLPVILKKARQQKILPADFRTSHQSIYRIYKRYGVTKQDRFPEDRRRFEVEFPNELWQSDCMHGPKVTVDGRLRKSYLFGIIDDHSRLIPHGQFYLRENIDSFQDCLIQALEKRGLPRKLYVDHGPCFRSQKLKYACASLGIALVYATPYSPAGKGKIERLWKTIRMQVLPLLPEVITLEQLNESLWEWIDKEYHLRVHGSTRQQPLKRYLQHIEMIRPAPKGLREYFRKSVLRKVDKDRTVSLSGRLYEAPLGLIDKRVRLLYDEQDPQRIEVVYEEKSYGFLIPLNLQINSRVRRASGRDTELVPPPSAAKDQKKAQPPTERYRGGKLFEQEGPV